MERVNQILKHPKYWDHLQKISQWEKDRIFCKHDIVHFLDVCRIAWILVLEEHRSTPKEWVYAAGLLHDIGRWIQYENKADHARESAKLCQPILVDCGFAEEERCRIIQAIASHRVWIPDEDDLSSVLYRGDKLSRRCWECPAADQCDKIKNGVIPPLQY